MELPEPRGTSRFTTTTYNFYRAIKLSIASSNLPLKSVALKELANSRCPAMELPEPQCPYTDWPKPPRNPA